MTIIPFANNKGGIGKTTSTQNVAACLLEQGYRLLLIDFDAQGSLTTSFGVPFDSFKYISGDWLLEKCSFEDVVIRSEDGKFSLLPSSERTESLIVELQGKSMYHSKLMKALKPLKDQYDVCLIDCPPGLNSLSTNALYAADYYFVPLEPTSLAYQGLANFLSWVDRNISTESNCKFGGVFPIKYQPNMKRRSAHKIVARVKEQLGDYFLSDFNIRTDVKIDEAQDEGKDVFQFEPNCRGAEDFRKLTGKIIEIVGLEKTVLSE